MLRLFSYNIPHAFWTLSFAVHAYRVYMWREDNGIGGWYYHIRHKNGVTIKCGSVWSIVENKHGHMPFQGFLLPSLGSLTCQGLFSEWFNDANLKCSFCILLIKQVDVPKLFIRCFIEQSHGENVSTEIDYMPREHTNHLVVFR